MIADKRAQILPLSFVIVLSVTIVLGLLSGLTAVGLAEIFVSRSFTYFLVFVLSLLVFVPLLQRLARRSFDLPEPGVWFALYYFTHFGMRAIAILMFGSPILGLDPEADDYGLINLALGVSIVGLSMFWIGYHARLGRVLSRSLPILPSRWSGAKALGVALLCCMVGWSIRISLMYYQAGGVGAWLESGKSLFLTQGGLTYLMILSNMAAIGLLIIFIIAKVRRGPGLWVLFSLFLIPELGFRFVSGSRAQFVFLLMGLLMGLYMTSRRDRKAASAYIWWAGASVVLLIALYPLFSVIRGGLGDLGFVLSRTVSFWKNFPLLFEVIAMRQHGLDSLALVIDRVPEEEPYTFGSELLLPLVAWIPRAFWADKPIISLGKIFYEKFYPHIFHEGTSVAVTLPGAFYWAFGLGGVLLGMALIGILWRFLFEYLVRPRGNISNILIISAMFPTFFVPVEQYFGDLLTMHLFQLIILVFITISLRGKSVELKS